MQQRVAYALMVLPMTPADGDVVMTAIVTVTVTENLLSVVTIMKMFIVFGVNVAQWERYTEKIRSLL